MMIKNPPIMRFPNGGFGFIRPNYGISLFSIDDTGIL